MWISLGINATINERKTVCRGKRECGIYNMQAKDRSDGKKESPMGWMVARIGANGHRSKIGPCVEKS